MTTCPHCKNEMDYDSLNSLLDDISSNKPNNEIISTTLCCNKKIKGINDFGRYYMISEPPKDGEERVFIGAQ